jgi:hypothetical protein
MWTHFSSKLVHEHLQRLSVRISGKVDRRTQQGSIFGILELDDDLRDVTFLCRCFRLD